MRFSLALPCIVLAAVVWAQPVRTSSSGKSGPDFIARTSLVQINANVVDDAGRLVDGLHAEDFRVYERGEPQRLVGLSMDNTPVSMAIVFDASGSMREALPLAKRAVRELVERSGARDEFAVVTVRGRPEQALNFDTDPESIVTRLGMTEARGTTALIDAVYLAARKLQKARFKRRAILVVSDGIDNASRYRKRELLRLLEESDLTLYAVAVGVHRPAMSEDVQPELSGANLLSAMAETTGGRYFEVEYPEQLRGVMRKVDIGYQYLLSIRPTAFEADGKYHKLEVKLSRAHGRDHLRVHYRPGYYAVAQ